MAKILFVCTGNTCRSVMAEALAKRWLEERGYHSLAEVTSAGLSTLNDLPVTAQAIEVMRQRNLDVSNHRSRVLDETAVVVSDLILVMTSGHRAHLLASYPQAVEKTMLLSPNGDIADPFGGSVTDYENCARQLEAAVAGALEEFFAEK